MPLTVGRKRRSVSTSQLRFPVQLRSYDISTTGTFACPWRADGHAQGFIAAQETRKNSGLDNLNCWTVKKSEVARISSICDCPEQFRESCAHETHNNVQPIFPATTPRKIHEGVYAACRLNRVISSFGYSGFVVGNTAPATDHDGLAG